MARWNMFCRILFLGGMLLSCPVFLYFVVMTLALMENWSGVQDSGALSVALLGAVVSGCFFVWGMTKI